MLFRSAIIFSVAQVTSRLPRENEVYSLTRSCIFPINSWASSSDIPSLLFSISVATILAAKSVRFPVGTYGIITLGLIAHWDKICHRILSDLRGYNAHKEYATSHFKSPATPIIQEVVILSNPSKPPRRNHTPLRVPPRLLRKCTLSGKGEYLDRKSVV